MEHIAEIHPLVISGTCIFLALIVGVWIRKMAIKFLAFLEDDAAEVPRKAEKSRKVAPTNKQPTCPRCKSTKIVNGQLPMIGGTQSSIAMVTIGKLDMGADRLCADCGRFMEGQCH